MSRSYHPVFLIRCQTCGGQNVLVHEGNPEDVRYKCAHHGGDDEEAPFHESGLGKVRDHYEFVDFVIVKSDGVPLTLDHTFAPEEAETVEIDESPAYSDYFEVVVKDRDMTKVANERDVKRGTVYANVRHARKMLSM